MDHKRVTEDLYMTEWGDKGYSAMISFEARTQNDTGKIEDIPGGNIKIKHWGSLNTLPQYREDLICKNNIVATLIETKRDIIIGTGLMGYNEKIEDRKIVIEPIVFPENTQVFVDRIEEDDYFQNAAGELSKHSNLIIEFIRDKSQNGNIVSMKAQPCKYMRAGKKDSKGIIKTWYFSTSWGKDDHSGKTSKPTPIPAYDPNKKQEKFIIHYGLKLLCPDGYYYSPTYWGGKTWIELSNSIPEFHKNNLKNSYSIKYHIEIPVGYFKKSNSQQQNGAERDPAKDLDEEKNARQKFLDDMNEFLAGLENTGRAVYTEYDINRNSGKIFPGIKITPLKVDMQDETLLKLFDKSNQANISAQAIHPTLAAIETEGKLSSGSEIRNAYLMYLATKAPTPRKVLLKALKFVQKVNGWDPKLKFAFKDVEITNLDENKSGKQNAVQPNE